MDVPEARITVSETVSDKTRDIKNLTHFVSLVVNVVKNSAACANFDAMNANGSPHLLRDF